MRPNVISAVAILKQMKFALKKMGHAENGTYACDCSSVSSVPSFEAPRRPLHPSLRRQHLRSASRRKLNMSRFRRSTFSTRTFLVAGKTQKS